MLISKATGSSGAREERATKLTLWDEKNDEKAPLDACQYYVLFGLVHTTISASGYDLKAMKTEIDCEGEA